MIRTVAIIDAEQLRVDPAHPETLCGVNVLVSSFLRALMTPSTKFQVSVLCNDQGVHDLRLRFEECGLSDLHVDTYRNFVASHSRRDAVTLQVLGHRLDRAAALRAHAGNPRWSILGMTHDLSDRRTFEALVLYALLVRPHGDTIVCASHAAQKMMQHYVAKIEASMRAPFALQLPIVPHGVDIGSVRRRPREVARRDLSIDSKEIVYLYFGRLSLSHKADLIGLINCFRRTLLGKNATLILAGGVPNPRGNSQFRQLEELQSIAPTLEGATVKILANVDDYTKELLFSAADVFVSPANSLQETFGLSLVEAMLYQLPVVATRWSGYSDTVTAKTGVLVDVSPEGQEFVSGAGELNYGVDDAYISEESATVRVDWQAFGKVLESLYSSRDLRCSLGFEGLNRAREYFTIEKMVGAYRELWGDPIRANCHRDGIPDSWFGPSGQHLLNAAM